MGQFVSKLEVQFYDVAVPDWPGEIDFYRAIAADVKAQGGSVLEVGCGTGRVTCQLAQAGMRIMGMDLSPSMLAVARQKSQELSNVRWVEGDMQAFELDECFDLILVPGHSFQFMLTPADQVACLTCIRQHLTSGGKLVVHLNHDDLSWLGGLVQGQGTGFELRGRVPSKFNEGLCPRVDCMELRSYHANCFCDRCLGVHRRGWDGKGATGKWDEAFTLCLPL